MTLQTSGAISLSQARDEFGLGNPVSMSQLYGKGGLQGSGAISMGDLYGRANDSSGTGGGGDTGGQISVNITGTPNQSGSTPTKNFGSFVGQVTNASGAGSPTVQAWSWQVVNQDGGTWSITKGNGTSTATVAVSDATRASSYAILVLTVQVNNQQYQAQLNLSYSNNNPSSG